MTRRGGPQPCFNYHFKTNEPYLAEMERSRPIPTSLDDLVCSTFKPQYHHPIHDWLLIQTDKKRSKLQSFLQSIPTTKRPPTPRRLERRPDLVAESPKCQIDFNRSIFGPPPWQHDPRALAPTGIARDEIFGHTEPWKPRDYPGIHRYSEHLVQQLFQGEAAARLCEFADENYELLNELNLWTEKKTNGYPVDPFGGFDNLRPKPERKLVKAIREEDHSWPPGHRRIQKTKVTRDLSVRSKGRQNSSYREGYCDQTHEDLLRGWGQPPTQSWKPMQNSVPFGVFPEVRLSSRKNRKEEDEWAEESRRDARANKAIFNGPTCL
jgi:hypothetical protein